MQTPAILQKLVHVTPITQGRIWSALAVAVAADGLQILLGPLGWTFVDPVVDVITMIVVSRLIGFHPLFLPAFAVELVPVADMLPTWVGCVLAVVALRKATGPAAAPAQTIPPIIGQSNKAEVPAPRQIDV
jgi:hypothetical protein